MGEPPDGWYLAARGYCVLCALGLLVSALASQLLPELYYDHEPAASSVRSAAEVALVAGYAGLLLLPFRWGLRTWWYPVRLGLLGLASIWILIRAAVGVRGVLAGERHPTLLVVSLAFLVLAAAAPACLVLRSRGWEN